MRSRTRSFTTTAIAAVVLGVAALVAGPHLAAAPIAEDVAVPTGNASAGVPARATAAGVAAALRALRAVAVSDSYVPAYNREAFGQAWADTDHNGCDTRNDALRAGLTAVKIKPGTNGCVVLSGTLNDPYTAATIHFVRGYSTSELVPIDHVVPLGYAWQHGAAAWTSTVRERFANDLAELQPVDQASNTAKSDSGPADWMPQNKAYWCTYDTRWVQLLTTYRLSVRSADKSSMSAVLTDCAAR